MFARDATGRSGYGQCESADALLPRKASSEFNRWPYQNRHR